jgi:hypothetical protein
MPGHNPVIRTGFDRLDDLIGDAGSRRRNAYFM